MDGDYSTSDSQIRSGFCDTWLPIDDLDAIDARTLIGSCYALAIHQESCRINHGGLEMAWSIKSKGKTTRLCEVCHKNGAIHSLSKRANRRVVLPPSR